MRPSSFEHGKFYLSALLLGVSIAVKWVSGPLVLWWLWRAWRERGLGAALWTGILAALPMTALLLIFFPGTAWHQLGPHDWITYSWSAPLLPGLIKWLTGFAPHNQFYLLPVLCAAVVIALRTTDPWRAATQFFFAVLIFSPAIHAWYFTWFIAIAVCAPALGWSARLVGISGFAYFWLQHVNATQHVWALSPQMTALIWLPFVLPALLTARWRRAYRMFPFNLSSGNLAAQ